MKKIGDMPLCDGDSLPVYNVDDPDIMRAEHAQIGSRHALRVVPLGGMWFMHMSDVDWLLATAMESMSHERFWTQVAIVALLQLAWKLDAYDYGDRGQWMRWVVEVEDLVELV